MSSKLSARTIFESNLSVISDKCDEMVVIDEEAVSTNLSYFRCIFGREERNTSSSEIQKRR